MHLELSAKERVDQVTRDFRSGMLVLLEAFYTIREQSGEPGYARPSDS